MIYAYCITGDLESVAGLPGGLRGEPVQMVSAEGITALVSDLKSDQGMPSPQNVLAHHEIVQAACRISPSVVPCRFGTVLSDREKLASLLAANAANLRARLKRITGKVELGVTIAIDGQATPSRATPAVPDDDPIARPISGASYLLEKRRCFEATRDLEERGERLGQELSDATLGLWTETRVDKRQTGDRLLLALSFLVDRAQLAAFRREYLRFRDGRPDAKLLYTGPWPPYNFSIPLKAIASLYS